MPELARRVAFVGVLFTVLVVPIENVVVLPGVGSLSRLLGIFLVLSAVPAFLGRGHFSIRRHAPAILLLALYVLWAFAGLMWSVEPESTLGYVFTFIQLLILVTVIWQVCSGESDLRWLQQAYVVGGGLAIVDGFRNFLLGKEAVFQRFAVSNTDPNEYALVLALGIPMAWSLFSRGSGWVRFLNLLFVPLALGAIVLSGSRGGAIAAGVALLVFPLGFGALDRYGKRSLLTVLAVSLLAVPFFWDEVSSAVGTNIERIGSLGGEISSGTLNARTVIWDAGIDAMARRPLIGVGGGAFPGAIEKSAGFREPAHNTFLSVLVEMGTVGLLLFVTIIIVIAAPLIRNYGARTMPGVVLLSTLLVGIIPLTWEFRKPMWLVLAMLIVLGNVQVRRLPAPNSGQANTSVMRLLVERRLRHTDEHGTRT